MLTPTDKAKVLHITHYDPKTGFGGAVDLFNEVKKHGIKFQQLQDFLQNTEVGQILKETTKNLIYGQI